MTLFCYVIAGNEETLPKDSWGLKYEDIVGYKKSRTGKVTEEYKIGSGSFGIVFKATYKGFEVAVKMPLNPDTFEKDSTKKRGFAREADTLDRLNHPNVVVFVGAVRYCYNAKEDESTEKDASTALPTSINAHQTMIAVADATHIAVGNYLGVGDEMMYVKSVDGNYIGARPMLCAQYAHVHQHAVVKTALAKAAVLSFPFIPHLGRGLMGLATLLVPWVMSSLSCTVAIGGIVCAKVLFACMLTQQHVHVIAGVERGAAGSKALAHAASSDERASVTVYESEPCYWIVTERLGQTLCSYLKTADAQDALKKYELSVGMAEGLAYLHLNKLIHRDIKPCNIMISETEFTSNEGPIPKFIDFGLSKFKEDLASQSVTQVAGTMDWMAPEKLQGQKSTFACDVFSFGLVLAYVHTDVEPKMIRVEGVNGEKIRDLRKLRDILEKVSNSDDAYICAQISLQCIGDLPSSRPSASVIAVSVAAKKDLTKGNNLQSVNEEESDEDDESVELNLIARIKDWIKHAKFIGNSEMRAAQLGALIRRKREWSDVVDMRGGLKRFIMFHSDHWNSRWAGGDGRVWERSERRR